jgi:uncharacterized damage-inducible protein DinB
MVGKTFTNYSRRLLTADYLPKIEACLHRLSEEDVWWRPNEASNSIGNLILHLCGNVTMWIMGGVGGRNFKRNRQQEFDERKQIPKDELLAKLRRIVEEADEVIESLDENELLTPRQIQSYDVTVLEAVYHVVEHFSMHTGQIILLSKARVAEDLRLWEQPDTLTSL